MMNGVRRGGTPESDAVASSEDERPWPSSTSFGSLPRKENGVPGLPGNIWSTSSQKRGSFKLSEAAQRNAAREARLGASNPPSSLRTANTPSPSVSEGADSLPFAIPLQPTQKVHRSLSHSQGQREASQPALSRLASPGSGEGAALPTSLLANLEEVDAEPDSEMGGPLAQTVSHPPLGALQRASTYSAAYDRLYALYGEEEEQHNGFPAGLRGSKDDDRFDAAFANLTIDAPHRRTQWESNLGFGIAPINESRRHSLAEIPTRRNSFDQEDTMGCMPSRPKHQPLRIGHPVLQSSAHSRANPTAIEKEPPRELVRDMRHNEDPTRMNFHIPASYRVPFVDVSLVVGTGDTIIDEGLRRNNQNGYGIPATPRLRKVLYVVSFKNARVDVFHLLEGTGLNIRVGDLVIVEADRGQDLGTVQHANVTPDEARIYKRKYAEEQYKWLMMFSVNNDPNRNNPNARVYGENSAPQGLFTNAPPAMQGMPRENYTNLKPKAIKRLASAHEIKMLAEKEGNEAKAKRTCQQKVAHLHLQMEILDAEWQWDFQKIIFYYYADHYIDFKPLIAELYRIYKTRIWLSAVNPASFSQHAQGQPPSGIGPGAVVAYNGPMDNTYAMAYGPDPDPYGAIPPYQIGAYDPNYPSIPGIANSFPSANNGQAAGSNAFTPTAAVFHPASNATSPMPTMPPGTVPTGMQTDYAYYYDRSGNSEQNANDLTNAMTNILSPTPATTAGASQHANSFMGNYWQQSAFNGFHSPTPGVASSPLNSAFSQYPWNPSSSSVNPAARGLGRQDAGPPQPIGTARPRSNGNASSSYTAANNFGQPPSAEAGNERARQYRPAPSPSTGLDPFNHRGSASSNWRSGAVLNNFDRHAEIDTWVRSQVTETQRDAARRGGYADEMSRER
ncbi:hypothetical protein BAUCODRAFT_196344 [Baudoinia panamericana UAMH 10762]|uniref:PSP1 C-terminal domain-containing protein n=1 Tax=Baudoinia panamericana (strain UAMH 10762) TaxID=717646 RepID=M2NQ24_BAUPA|nr:uncharacterized protein BAUCODRAFT_196344 [Baudoinia panamericana UAMH 10762]EMD01111.1 hypothetical protein BAUCODRAFT_196344 [Baudoinia panamericana UAMH 10762]